MNIYEQEIAMYDKRVKRMEENPDPNKLKATKMLYELLRDGAAAHLQHWKEGKPFISGGFGNVTRALGLVGLDNVQTVARAKDVSKYMDILRAAGYPDDGCEMGTVGMAMLINGDLPLPSIATSCMPPCEPVYALGLATGHLCNIPRFNFDIALENNYDTLRYLANQIEEFIDFAESHVPGVHFDEEKLLELQEIDRAGYKYMAGIYKVRSSVPCPIGGQDVFRNPVQPSGYALPKRGLEYLGAYYEEVAERAEKGIGPVMDEKLRVMWAVSGPLGGFNFSELLAKRGVSIVHFMVGGAYRRYGLGPNYGDETEYGRKLTPLEEEARIMNRNSWGSVGTRWIGDTLRVCRELNIEAIIVYELWGCMPTVGLNKVLAEEAAKKEVGIPVLVIPGRQKGLSQADERELEERLNQFIDVCLMRKGMG